ncbi:MAG TPA: lysophospholipid acyltransferase family protein [Hanamia sp.]|nr:lysophospholipid acyltransferase family protein [Hanamia sp.]
MKNFLAKIMAVWALIVFIITILPVALLMWIIGIIDEPKRTKIFRVISKIWMRLFFILTGCGLKIIGKNNFKAGEKYIVTCNHNSFMDVPVATPFIPGANKTIAKAEMAKIPVFGLIYKRGSILVDRNDKSSRRDSFRKMKEVLNLGMHMCIYPEGTRNKTDLPLKEFHDGAFKLAIDTGTSILPAILFNTKKILPPGKLFYYWPAKMEIHFLQPIAVNHDDNYEMLKENVHRIMSDYYVSHKK